jgi:hypothetical protein
LLKLLVDNEYLQKIIVFNWNNFNINMLKNLILFGRV